MESTSLLEGGPRVKFTTEWKGKTSALLEKDKVLSDNFHQAYKWFKLATRELEESGVTPVLPDGKIAGNLSMVVTDEKEKELILVTKSGKIAKQSLVTDDLVLVETFDNQLWKAKYFSESETIVPTSDTPMHFAALHAWSRFSWTIRPKAILHGHAFETEKDATKLGLPISMEETLFSTPEDTKALLELFKHYSYPAHNIFVRKGHGFMLLAENIENALEIFRKSLNPYIQVESSKYNMYICQAVFMVIGIMHTWSSKFEL